MNDNKSYNEQGVVMHLKRIIGLIIPFILIFQPVYSQNNTPAPADKAAILEAMTVAGVTTDNLSLIQAHINDLSLEQLHAIDQFLTNPRVFADAHWFDVSHYTSWDDYNFNQPVGDKITGILARRDLFLDPALQLNNRAVTNMSPQTLAALAFSQVYVEEKWDHLVPWENDPNPTFNWIDPVVLSTPNIFHFIQGDFLYKERATSWWATYWSSLLFMLNRFNIGQGTDEQAALQGIAFNVPRLAGYSYPVGNQLYLQTAETAYWYADYLRFGKHRYGVFDTHPLDTKLQFSQEASDQWPSPLEINTCGSNPSFVQFPGLCGLLTAPFARQLRVELQQPETAAFWNVLRFLHAGARQREGGASPDHPENGQPAILALQYEKRTAMPVGRATKDISAFAIITTVYSDSLLLDFTNWDSNRNQLIQTPNDNNRSDGLNRSISERDKAIRVVEQLGSENLYSNATHISGSRGLGFNLVNQYDDPVNGDFLPYTLEEAHALVMALLVETRDYATHDSQQTLCGSPLLKQGYEAYTAKAIIDNHPATDWITLTAGICS
jgi:hypothetical protein